MTKNYSVAWLSIFLILIGCFESTSNVQSHIKVQAEQSLFLSHEVDLSKSNLEMFWQDSLGNPLKSFAKLKTQLEGKNKQLEFAMNGGMFTKRFRPLGLYIENGDTKTLIKEDTSGYGNFYMQPNGVFLVTMNNQANIVSTPKFGFAKEVKFATQSGPLLIYDGTINKHFGVKSTSLYIRNGVGILPNGNVLFALSRKPVNFYSFANYFKQQGCKNALYLDGFVSRMYLPEKQIEQMDGQFGVMIAEVLN